MKYLILVYADEQWANGIPEGQRDGFMAEVRDWDAFIRRQGMQCSSHGLHPAQTATTVRVRAGKASMTDGPFAETKEQLVGLDVLDAENLDQALRVARRHPMALRGAVEVRPIRGSKTS